MLSTYNVVLQTGKRLSPGDFPEGTVVSIERTGDETVQLVTEGNRADAEKFLRGLKDSIRFYQRIDTAPDAAKRSSLRHGRSV